MYGADQFNSIIFLTTLISLLMSAVVKGEVLIIENRTLTEIQHLDASNLVSSVAPGEIGTLPLSSPMWLHFGMIQVQYTTDDLRYCRVSKRNGVALQFEALRDKRLRCRGSWKGDRRWYQFRYYIEPLQQVDST